MARGLAEGGKETRERVRGEKSQLKSRERKKVGRESELGQSVDNSHIRERWGEAAHRRVDLKRSKGVG